MRNCAVFSVVLLVSLGLGFGLGGCKSDDDDDGAAGTAPMTGGTGVMGTGGAVMMATGGTGVATGGTGMATGGTGVATGGTGVATGGTGMATGGTGMATGGTGMATGGTGMGTGGMMSGTGGASMGTGGSSPQSCIMMAAAMMRSGPCTDCGCNKCLEKIANCQDEACSSVVACGQKNKCKGRECFCGVGVPSIECALIPGSAKGPCLMEIAKAAGVCGTPAEYGGCALMLSAVTGKNDPAYDANNPVSRANEVSICTRGQDADPGPPESIEIMGMCETECMQ